VEEQPESLRALSFMIYGKTNFNNTINLSKKELKLTAALGMQKNSILLKNT
jgi:hypothetical protein